MTSLMTQSLDLCLSGSESSWNHTMSSSLCDNFEYASQTLTGKEDVKIWQPILEKLYWWLEEGPYLGDPSRIYYNRVREAYEKLRVEFNKHQNLELFWVGDVVLGWNFIDHPIHM